jgi:hypothetical protein
VAPRPTGRARGQGAVAGPGRSALLDGQADWDGYGGLVLQAAYDERPDLRPGQRTGLLGRKLTPDAARSFAESKAYQSAAKAPVKYPSLLSGVEWWLPLSEGPHCLHCATTDRPADQDGPSRSARRRGTRARRADRAHR